MALGPLDSCPFPISDAFELVAVDRIHTLEFRSIDWTRSWWPMAHTIIYVNAILTTSSAVSDVFVRKI